MWDLLEAMTKDAGRSLNALKVDGGAAKNDLLVQFQADVGQVVVVRPVEVESTGRGAAMLAGVGAELSTSGAFTSPGSGWSSMTARKIALMSCGRAFSSPT